MASTESAGASQLSLAWHVGGPVWMLVMMTCAEHPQLWPRQSPPTPPLGLFQSQCPTALCLLATAQGRVTCRQSTPPLLSSNITGTAMLLTDQHLITCHSRLYIPIILGEAMFSMHEQDCSCFMVMSLQSIPAVSVMLHVYFWFTQACIARCCLQHWCASFQLCKAARSTFTCQRHLMSKFVTLMQYTAALDSLS